MPPSENRRSQAKFWGSRSPEIVPKKLRNRPMAESGELYRFGPFSIDARAGILFLEGQPTMLGQRAVTLLRELLAHAGAPVSKDALISAAWPGLAIEESNLTVQVAALR